MSTETVREIFQNETVKRCVRENLLNENDLRKSLSCNVPSRMVRKLLVSMVGEAELANSSSLGYNPSNSAIPPEVLDVIESKSLQNLIDSNSFDKVANIPDPFNKANN